MKKMAQASEKKKENHTDEDHVKIPDPVALSQAIIDAYERAQPVFNEMIERYNENLGEQNFDPMNVGEAYMQFLQQTMNDPHKMWEAQADYWQKYIEIWQESTRKFMGEKPTTHKKPEQGDRRFKAKEWQESALFDFIKQSYLLTADWMENTVRDTDGLDAQSKEKLAFYSRQFSNAMSPTNFVMTNPDVLKETMKTGGQNLIKGFENLIEDIARGNGELKISTTDYKAFEPGKNLAVTPGQVVYQNDLMQLIQYEPTTEQVHKRPLLVVPPWINKYYILDLRPDNSFIRYAVEQGHTVFAVSWVNPSAKLAQKSFEDYMNEGILMPLDEIKTITGEPDCNVVGYCLGGTLLTTALSYLTEHGQADRVASATFLTTLLDFEEAGEMKLFMDDGQLAMMDKAMAEKGVLQAKALQKTFSLLRSNDLIWSFVVNNYLMGKEPFPFDLLYWNDDSTNMPAAMHSFYLRNMYRDNMLTKAGGITMNDTPVDVKKIKTPAYFLSTREDHIAPWKATYAGTQMLSGPKTFTLAASGHIAGVVNAPAKNKYCYWSADKTPANPENWLNTAQEHAGSWWPHWQEWLGSYTNGKVAARKIGKSIEPAPGSYVKVQS